MGRHMRQLLRESHTYRRVVGFGDAVADLGTHRICGTEAPYSRQAVYQLLYGKSASRKLLARIVEKRPDLLDLSFVCEATKAAARKIGWTPHMGMPRRENRGISAAAQRGETELSSAIGAGEEAVEGQA